MACEQGKAIVITGAASGIGEACATRLAAMGYTVFGTYLTAEEGESMRAAARSGIVPLPLDVTDARAISEVSRMISEATGEAGLAGLVNNAGTDIPGPLEFLPIESLRHQLEVNVIGQVAITQALLPLIRMGNGRIVMIGSIDGRAVTPFQGAYGASKHALEAVSDALRMELRPWAIHASVVEPGDIATPIWEKSLARADELLARLPQAAHALYGPMMKAARATAVKMSGKASPPEIVVRAVVHALTARCPRTRYLVGFDARLRLALEVLPARVVDRLILRFIARGGR
ncbi:MAG: SDR family oxidoreductase [Candidatus Hydrogenedentes bacterium]|nr:SDR family oxidoreductase [Candidatus Hydrogenedentota bacterium]